MVDNAAEVIRYQALARTAANALVDDWLAASQTLTILASALAACEAAPPGLRNLARQQAILLETQAKAGAAIQQRSVI